MPGLYYILLHVFLGGEGAPIKCTALTPVMFDTTYISNFFVEKCILFYNEHIFTPQYFKKFSIVNVVNKIVVINFVGNGISACI